MAASGKAGGVLTSGRIRLYHHRVVLQSLRRLGTASKADLARDAGLTNAAVGQIVADLQDLRLVTAVGKRHDGGRGQPATLLELDSSGAYGIGVRLDRTLIETALVDMRGALLAKRSRALPMPEPEEALAIVAEDVAALAAQADAAAPGRVSGVGLAMPFHLGAWLRQLGIDNPALARWADIDFAGALAARTGFEVHAENDGTAAAIAELFHGVGRERTDFLYLFIGPAIGGGVVLGGDYHRGIGGNGGDVAMLPTSRSHLPSAPVTNGPYEILLTRASISALVRHLAFRGVTEARERPLAESIARAPDAFAEWREDCIEALVAPILGAQALLDVPAIVIDGDLDRMAIGDIVAGVAARLAGAAPEAVEPAAVIAGSFGSDAHAVGAASLPLFTQFAPRAALADNVVTADFRSVGHG